MAPRPNRLFVIVRTAVLLLGGLLALSARGEDKFTLAVIPDSQQEVLKEGDERLKNRMQWLADNKEALNLKMALHVGDMLNWDTPDHIQYKRASEAVTVLDKAGIPFAFTLGNHDTAATKEGGSAAPGNTNTNLRTTTTYDSFFPTTRFKALESTYEPGKIANACHAFKAGGLDWLVINMELWPRAGAVDWAKGVIEKHPNHNIIILTHSFLNGKGAIEQTKGGYGDNSPQYMFDNMLKPYPNVRLVFSGHTGSHAERKDQGANGNTIYQFVQCYHDNVANPVRLFEIDTKNGTIKSRVYTPSTDKEKTDGSTLTITDVKWVEAKAQADVK
ncbi:MAG: metallophosphoesterase [Candidatus Sumerlaeota bacterium]|nr:metallophosphoesterase [Candidatus Sumerlaeota bacterium]